MKRNIFKTAFEWFKSLFKKSKKKSLLEMYEEKHPSLNLNKKIGRGAYYNNNRKRTKGRTLQCIKLHNGTTKFIRHETI